MMQSPMIKPSHFQTRKINGSNYRTAAIQPLMINQATFTRKINQLYQKAVVTDKQTLFTKKMVNQTKIRQNTL
jgi:hypothetical protein